MTIQTPEKILYQGEWLDLVMPYPPLPKKDYRVIYVDDFKPDILDIVDTTMCYRRYIGTWEIREGKLYLSDLKGWYQLNSPEPILADWFTGSLVISKVSNFEEVGRFHVEVECGLVVC